MNGDEIMGKILCLNKWLGLLCGGPVAQDCDHNAGPRLNPGQRAGSHTTTRVHMAATKSSSAPIRI